MKQVLLNQPKNRSYDDGSDCKAGVQIEEQSFKIFCQKNFKNRFRKKSYKWTVCGVSSSLVIHQLLCKMPTLNQFVYDFDDEFDDFQLIWDFFNFNDFKINPENMNSLFKNFMFMILNDLKIEIPLSCICEQNSIIQSIDNLFELLYQIKKYYYWFFLDYNKWKC